MSEPHRKARKVLALEQKVEIIHKVELGAKHGDVADEYGVTRSTVSHLLGKKEKILEEAGSSGLQRKTLKRSKYSDLDTALLLWYSERRADSTPINEAALRSQAKVFAKQLGKTDFKGSQGFLYNFKKRHGILSKHNSSADCPEWQVTLPKLFEGYDPDDVFNGGESALFYTALPTRTLAYQKDKCKGRKHDRVTFVLFSNMSGSEIMRPVVIGRYQNPRCFSQIHLNVDNLPVDYYWSANACMTKELWTRVLVQLDLNMRVKSRKILLFLDSSSAHLLDGDVTLTNVKLALLPKNSTSVLQPLNHGIIRAVKVHYRSALVQRLIVHLESKRPIVDFELSLLDAIQLLAHTWQSLSRETIVRAFRKAGFLETDVDVDSQIDGGNTEDSSLPVGDIFDTLQELLQEPLDVNFDQYVDIDCDIAAVETMTDTDIDVDIVQHVRADINADSAEDRNTVEESERDVSIYEVIDALRVVQSYLDKRGIRANAISVEQAILDARFQLFTQTKIDDYLQTTGSKL